MRNSRAPLIISLVAFAFFVLPIYYLVIGISFFATTGAATFVIFSESTLNLLVTTLEFGFGSGLLAAILGIMYAWILYRTDISGKRIFELLPLLGLTMPLLLKVFAWIFLFSPENGIANQLLGQAGLPGPIFNIFSMPGMIFSGGLDALPIALLIVGAAVQSMDPSLEEASRIAGNSLLKTFFSVSLPALLPAVLSAFLLLSLIVMNFVEVPFILGRGYVNTLTTELYYWAAQHPPPRYDVAATIGLVNVILTIAIFAAYIYVTRKSFKFVVVTGKASRQTVHKLRNWRWLGFLICLTVLVLVFILPFSVLVVMSFVVRGTIFNATFGTANYVAALKLPDFFKSISNSLLIAGAVGILATLLGMIMSYAALKSRVPGARLVEFIGNIPLTIPGVVYGFALFITFLLAPGLNILYGTIIPLIIAVTFGYLPTSIRIVSSNLVQISDELEEASRVSGASWSQTFSHVIFSILRFGLFNSFVRAFLDSIRELGPVILLSTPGSTVITVVLFTLYTAQASALNTVAAASVMVTVITASFLIFFKVLERVIYGPHGR